MSKKIDKSLILNKIKLHYQFKNDAEFARFLGIKPQTLASWHTRNTFDIDLLYAKCELIDGNWLLSGKGEILRNKISVMDENLNKNIEEKSYTIEIQKKYIKTLENQLNKSKNYPEVPITLRGVAEDKPKLK